MARSSRGSASSSEMRPALRSRMRSSTQAGRGRLPITVVGNSVGSMEGSSGQSGEFVPLFGSLRDRQGARRLRVRLYACPIDLIQIR